MKWMRAGRRALLPLVLAALVAGGVAIAVGADAAGRAIWQTATLLVASHLIIVTASRLRQGRIAVDVVALLALFGALALGEALAGVIVALMVETGDALEHYAHRRARRDLSRLLSMAPTVAHRVVGERMEDLAAAEVAVGDVVLVKPGEVVPVDGVVLEAAVLDESVLTGEAVPVERSPGEAVRSGSVNAGGAFRARAMKTSENSAYAGIVRLVRAAGVGRAPFVRLADHYAVVFVPVVLAIACLAWAVSGDPVRALAVLVVATPCPLVLAAPVAVVSGIARAASVGVVLKDGAALEALARVRTVLVDKTGTLTAGRPRVIGAVVAPGGDLETTLALAASLEQASPHVFASAVVEDASARGLDLAVPRDVVERPGAGVRGRVLGHDVVVGARAAIVPGVVPSWMSAAARRAAREGCSSVAVVVDGHPAALVLLSDELRTDTPRAVRSLRRAGVDRVVMVTGDRIDIAGPLGEAIGADAVYADRSPGEKVDIVRTESESRQGTTVMVGDGVNDAPALAAADLGVALGARGATASSETADVVLVVDRLDRLATGVTIAQRATAIARQSVLLGMGLSFVAMGFAAVGWLPPVGGAVLQEIIDVLAIANALRVLRRPRADRHRRPVPAVWARQLGSDHGRLRQVLDDVRATADTLESGRGPVIDVRMLRGLAQRVQSTVVSHERTDETVVYPALAVQLGGDDPLAAMSRTHREIFHLAALLDRIVVDAEHEGFDPEDQREARRVLYALDAVVSLHLAQEEELLAMLSAKAGDPEPTLERAR
jgi:heavy metal translocating P-type ATPase